MVQGSCPCLLSSLPLVAGAVQTDEKPIPILHQFLTPESFQLLKTALLWLKPINLSFLC